MTSLRSFYEEHMQYVGAQDIATMVNSTYDEGAVLYHNFPYFEGPAPYLHEGKAEIIRAHLTIFSPENHGAIKAGAPFNYIEEEGESTIFFQIPIETPNRGNWVNTDFWILRDGKLYRQYVFGTRVGG